MTRKAAMLVVLVGLVGCASPDGGSDMSRRDFMMRPGLGMNSCAACASYPPAYPQTPPGYPPTPPGYPPTPPAYPQAPPGYPPTPPAPLSSTATPVRPGPPQYLPPPAAVAPGRPAALVSLADRPADNPLSMPGSAVQPAPGRAVPGGEIAQTAASLSAPELDPGRQTVAAINSRRIALNYQVKDGGVGDDSRIELWYTHDGKPWELYQASPSHQPPFIVEVKEEGQYGFALVARPPAAAVRPPQANEPPQVQVEVDLTSPVVQLLGVQPDANPENRSVTVLWQASDKHLGPQPIALSWARDAAGPWFPITSQLENTGRYVWRLPAGLPPQVWVRVEAADLAGNVGMAQTPEAIAVDRAPANLSVVNINSLEKSPLPRIAVVGVEPVPEPPPVRASISAVDFTDK